MRRNFVLYMLVLVASLVLFNGCFYRGWYSGEAPNSAYRGDNQGTPGLRVQPMEFGLTQEQLMSMSDEEYEKLMERMADYNELMRDSSYSEGYDAAMKSGWTRRNISTPSTPQSIPSRREMRAMRAAELRSSSGGQDGGQQGLVMPPQPQKEDFASEGEYRQAYRAWLQLGKSFQSQHKGRY